jgi:hypothetical protein
MSHQEPPSAIGPLAAAVSVVIVPAVAPSAVRPSECEVASAIIRFFTVHFLRHLLSPIIYTPNRIT